MEPQEYNGIIRHLVRITAHQETINENLRAMLNTHDEQRKQQVAINERLTTAIERLDTTRAGIETLLARTLRYNDNGRDA